MTKFTKSSYGNIAYEDTGGANPAAIFIHGNSSCKEAFHSQFESSLRKNYRLVALDLPGHGESDNAGKKSPEETYSIGSFAVLIKELIGLLNLASPTLVGWSLGGHIALEFGARYPKVLSGMVITGTPPIDPGGENMQEAFLSSEAMGLTAKEVFSDEDARLYTTCTLGRRHLVTDHFLNMTKRTDGLSRRCVLENWSNPSAGESAIRFIENWEKPIAAVHGEEDAFISAAYLAKLKWNNLWHKKIYIFPNAGHAPFLEKRDEFNDFLGEFMADTSKLA